MRKGKGYFIQKLNNLGGWQAPASKPSLLENPEENPTTLCQTNPRLQQEFLLPLKKRVLWEPQVAAAPSSKWLGLFQVAVQL